MPALFKKFVNYCFFFFGVNYCFFFFLTKSELLLFGAKFKNTNIQRILISLENLFYLKQNSNQVNMRKNTMHYYALFQRG